MVTELADGVVQLTPMPLVNVVAVRGADGWTLVDAGVPATAQRLVEMLGSLGIGRGDVERIVLTHGHADHAGGAATVRDAVGARDVLVGGPDVAPVQQGTNPPGGLPGRVAGLPGPAGRVGRFPKVPEAAAVGGAIDLGEGRTLVPVPTPGHTAGHVSFHLPSVGVVLGGDAVFNVFRLAAAPGFLCADAPRNEVSILTLAALSPSTLQLAHGSPVTGDVAGRLRELVLG